MSSYFQVNQVTKVIDGTTILDQISFEASQGEFVSLLGPSGCGKSSLLRAISGLMPIDGGQIQLAGQDITTLSPKKRGISMVFQNYALFPNMTVFKNIEFGLKVQKNGMDKKARQMAVIEMAKMVDLEAHLEKYPHQLSGGQCQRVALARSLIIKPQLLLLDEPLSALDAKIRKHLRKEIRNIQKSLNLTVIFVTHDQEEALELSDKIIVLNKGTIAQEGDSKSIYLSPSSHFVAEFIGNYNLLSPTEFATITGKVIDSTVAIRPEALIMQNHGIPAKIVDYTLLGNVIRYQIAVKDKILQLDHLYRTEQDLLAPNDPIHFVISDYAPIASA